MSTIPFDAFRREVLDLYRPPLRAKLTHLKMRQVLDLCVDPVGLSSPAELTPAAVARFVAAVAPGRAPRTVRGLLSYLSAACSYAVFRRYLDQSPFAWRRQWVRHGALGSGSDVPVGDSSEVGRHHSREAIARVLESLRLASHTWDGGRLHALACTYAYAALRLREALYLRVEDIDLELGVLRVTPRWRPLKTDQSASPVPIAPPLRTVLADWLPRCESPWVFPTLSRERPWTGGPPGRKPTHRLTAAGRAVGVEGFTPLSLRHSFATHAEYWGLSELMVQRILRHSTTRTQRRYRHADLANMAEAATAIRF